MSNPRPSNSFKKGDPRINRKGRPKTGQSIAEKFRDALAEVKAEGNPDYTKLDALIDKVIQKALAGDQQSIEYCLARGYGKLIDRIESNVVNKNYDFTNLSLEERMKLLEQLRSARTTINSDDADNDNPDTI